MKNTQVYIIIHKYHRIRPVIVQIRIAHINSVISDFLSSIVIS